MQPSLPEIFLHRIFDEAFNQGNMAVVDELFSPQHLAYNNLDAGPEHSDHLKWQVVRLRTGFPDLHCAIEGEIMEADKLAARWTMQGTHRGLFMGNPPTGNKMKTQGSLFMTFKGGSLSEYWMLIDQFGLLQQLGIIPR